MEEELTIEQSNFTIPVINKMGNVDYDTDIHKVHLQNRNGEIISNNYYYIESLEENDHYIVGDLTTNQVGMDFQDEFEDENIEFKFGVIRLQRDKTGAIIPLSEKLVVPILYDRIEPNNLETITVWANKHLTYIDIHPKSKNYGKQLVPAVLEHAVPFDINYNGFAECSVSGVTGYIPRNCQPLTKLSPEDLLTEEQVKYLLSYFKICSNPLHDNSIEKLANLSDEVKILSLRRKKY